MRGGPRGRVRRGGAGLVVLLLAAATLGAHREAESEMKALRRAIEARREKVAEYERTQRGLFDALDQMDRTASALRAAAAHSRAEARSARQELATLTARGATLARRLDASRRAMAHRAVALYKLGAAGPVQVLFAAEDLRDLLGRVEALRRLLEHDHRLVMGYRRDRDALAAARTAAARAARRQEHAEARARVRLAELERERKAKTSLLARVRADRSREREALAELEAAARALEAKLAALPHEAPPAPVPQQGPSFASLRGRLPPPVKAPIVQPFGLVVDSQFHTQILHKGVDFKAPLGTPVRAVAEGLVRYAGWFRGYGRLVIVDHGNDYFTVLAHLDALHVGVGDVVHAGDVIGTVGETGSLVGPRLYFEIRHGSRAVNPAQWLAGAGAG